MICQLSSFRDMPMYSPHCVYRFIFAIGNRAGARDVPCKPFPDPVRGQGWAQSWTRKESGDLQRTLSGVQVTVSVYLHHSISCSRFRAPRSC